MEVNDYDAMKTSDLNIKVAMYMQELYEAFFSNKNLQTIIDKASKLIKRPLILYDSGFKILAASSNADSILQLEYDEDGNQCLSKEFIELFPLNSSLDERNPIIYYDHNAESLFGGTLIASVKIDVIAVATVAVFEIGISFQALDHMLIDKFRALLSAQLQRSILLNLDNNQHPSFVLADLIEGRTTDHSISDSKKAGLKWIRSDSLYILVICSGMQEAFDSKISVVFQTLKSYIPVNQRIIYNSSIVAFVDEILYETLFDSERGTFSTFIEENNLYVGISRKFLALSEARKQYQYASDALRIGQKRNTHCTRFDDCTLYIISDMISDRYDLMDICHPAVISLINYDRENGSSLLDTLKQYISFTSAPAQAAKALNIHRNTLFYRIGKIKELTGIKLDHGEEKSLILLSIKLLESRDSLR